MYIPRYKYLFFVERPRSLWTQKELIKYLNNQNIKPSYITKDDRIYDYLNMYQTDNSFSPSEIDILFSETYGIWPYSQSVLSSSKGAGITNLVIGNFPTINNQKPTFKRHYSPQNTTLIDGICLIDKRTEDCMKTINPDLDTIVTGNPEWDIVKTSDFKKEVEAVQRNYGKYLLLLCAGPFDFFKQEQEDYYKWVIETAEEQNFKVLVNLHAETEDTPDYLKDHMNTITHRYVNLVAASHIITRVASGFTQESLLFNKNVASNPFLFLGEKDAETGLYHEWIENDNRWKEKTLPRVGYELFNMLPLINNKQSLIDFLNSKTLNYTSNEIDEIFRMPRPQSYREYFFEKVDRYVGEKK